MSGHVELNWLENKQIYTQCVAILITEMTAVQHLNCSLQTSNIVGLYNLNIEIYISTRTKTSVSTWNNYCVGPTNVEQSLTVIRLDTRAWIFPEQSLLWLHKRKSLVVFVCIILSYFSILCFSCIVFSSVSCV